MVWNPWRTHWRNSTCPTTQSKSLDQLCLGKNWVWVHTIFEFYFCFLEEVWKQNLYYQKLWNIHSLKHLKQMLRTTLSNFDRVWTWVWSFYSPLTFLEFFRIKFLYLHLVRLRLLSPLIIPGIDEERATSQSLRNSALTWKTWKYLICLGKWFFGKKWKYNLIANFRRPGPSKVCYEIIFLIFFSDSYK